MKYYQVGGTLQPGNPSYVERQADRNLFEGLQAGKFCYVFNSRQMGKSSLRVQVSKKLENEGFRCGLITLDSFGTQLVTQEQWYYTFIKNLADTFELQIKQLSTWWQERKQLTPLQRLSDFFQEILLAEVSGNIVIFIDEIDIVLGLDFPIDDFFVFIRDCYNKRADNPNYNRITFALLGVATPSQLIQDKKRTPFNIGEAIQLNGFSFEEVRPLAQGLKNKVNNKLNIAEDLLQEVLNWTGGQPFITQKICKMIADSQDIIPVNREAIFRRVTRLVETKIIENWEIQDEPQHLRTIRDRIINSKEPILKLLKLYLKLLQTQELQVDDSPEQSELILSGLVVEKNGKLTISNKIYQRVFDSKWVDEMLADTRPYDEELLGWLSSERQNKSWLLRGQKLRKAIKWSAGKILTVEDYQFLNTSLELELKNAHQSQRIPWAIAAMLVVVIGVSVPQLTRRIQSLFIPYVSEPELFSQGERTFFLGNGNFYQIKGIEAFKRGDYSQAISLFEKAKSIDSNDPEAEIYYNNAQAHKHGSYLTLAVVVPVNSTREIAREILRGVAQAQTTFNISGGDSPGRLLNIIIVNDSNDLIKAQAVARELAKDSNVLGVIGHNASTASQAALTEYQKAGLAMISPTSTSTTLKSKVFFRAVPSDQLSAETLANYAMSKNINRVVIFYKEEDSYSESMMNAFKEYYTGEIVRRVNLADEKQDASDQLILSVFKDKAEAAVFFPSTELISTVIDIVRAYKKNQVNLPKNLELLGGESLYNPETLKQGEAALEGLVLAVPWFTKEPTSETFAKLACERWKGGVSWRTAMSYDATQAFTKALLAALESKKLSRQTVLEKLKSITVASDETSGDELSFNQGERHKKPVLVQVVKVKADKVKGGGDRCSGFQESGFHFEKVQSNQN
ncbi:AAA-like domain-containing protein [Brasilonema sp. UFV-L1]|uniref:AAA-like domain-containing protein n=1 Tax=Brasilonema sp. UFV-L1 TaxID=2234130 RepID=UPI00145F5DE9|nr:AAA-like domain-containing protein [Brasilonema sp. UFV-L1]NMG11335.1 hypothetical protein [Brasilonema sp. UFV-L1]